MRATLRRALLTVTLAAGPAAAQAPSDTIVGTWHGTSKCADREHYPACTDEHVIYDVRPHRDSPVTVTLRADKVVNGVREFMSENDFVRQADGAWTTDIRTPRVNLRVTLRIAADRMIGTVTDLTSDRRVRDMALTRAP